MRQTFALQIFCSGGQAMLGSKFYAQTCVAQIGKWIDPQSCCNNTPTY